MRLCASLGLSAREKNKIGFITDRTIQTRNDVVPTRGNPYKVLINVSRMNVRRHFFTERIALKLIWNSLPPSVVDFRTLLSFKRTITNAVSYTHLTLPTNREV